MAETFYIADTLVGKNQPAYLIAEAGVNHNGNLELAKELITVAKDAGVSAVKFQSFVVEELILESVAKAPYQKVTTGEAENQYQMLKSLEIDEAFQREIAASCLEKGVTFLSTPYDLPSLNLLLNIGVPAIKVASTDITNLLFLEDIARAGLPTIISTGMSNLFEIEQSYRCLEENGSGEISVLGCTTNYPTALEEVNLRTMSTLAAIFPKAVIGFSDHTAGLGASPFAAALGAKIIEKHFTLDKTLPGPDHKASLSPTELKDWVKAIRSAEKMLGTPEINPTVSELATKQSMQKYLVANDNIKPGDVFLRSNLVAKRTGGEGIPASMTFHVLGKNSKESIAKNQILKWSFIED